MIHLHTLPNGLTIVHEPSSSQVVYCGYVVRAGTRHEGFPDRPTAENGMAHFVEHLSFKGTERRTSLQISGTLERVGGELNAFTNKQETTYFAVVLRPDFPKAVDLLSDIVFHSSFPEKEMKKEAEVVCDEIESYHDAPSELIFDEFEQMVFRGHPLGRDILGDADALRAYTPDDIRAFAQRYYTPSNAVFFVYGNVDFARLVRLAERHTASLPVAAPLGAPVQPLPDYEVEERVVEKHTHQAHVMVGGRGRGGTAPQRYALMLLNNVLGGNAMSSRLNVAVRERAGLAYTIGSYLFIYPDAGAWGVYFGCDAEDIARCRRLIASELQRFVDHPLSAAALLSAKKQIKGQIALAQDSSEHHALALGKSMARYGHIRPLEETFAQIDALQASQIQTLAAELYAPDRLSTLIYR